MQRMIAVVVELRLLLLLLLQMWSTWVRAYRVLLLLLLFLVWHAVPGFGLAAWRFHRVSCLKKAASVHEPWRLGCVVGWQDVCSCGCWLRTRQQHGR